MGPSLPSPLLLPPAPFSPVSLHHQPPLPTELTLEECGLALLLEGKATFYLPLTLKGARDTAEGGLVGI